MAVSLIPPSRNNGGSYFNGSSTYGSVALSLSGWNQLSISTWLNWTVSTPTYVMALEYSPGGGDGRFLWQPNNGSSKSLFAWQTAAGGQNASFARPSLGIWHHILIVIDGTVSGTASIPAIYVDGISQLINYGFPGAGPQSLGNFTLYLMSRAGTGLFGRGAMAQLAMFAGSLLGAGDAAALAAGADPRTVSTGATHFWRLDRIGAEPNLGRIGAAAGIMRTTAAGMLALPAQLAPARPAPLSFKGAPAGTSLTADCPAATELRATSRRLTASQLESSRRAAANTSAQFGVTRSAWRGGPLPIEVSTGLHSERATAIEVGARANAGIAVTVGSRLGQRSVAAVPLESSGSLLVLRDAIPPIEAIATLRTSRVSPGELQASLSVVQLPAAEAARRQAALHSTPTGWTGAALIAIAVFGDIEFGAEIRIGTRLPGEWLTSAASAVINDSPLLLGWSALLPARITQLRRLLRPVGKKRLLGSASRVRLLAKE